MKKTYALIFLISALILSCNLPGAIRPLAETPMAASPSSQTDTPATMDTSPPTEPFMPPSATLPLPATSTIAPLNSLQNPPLAISSGAVFYDVDCAGTAAEGRAPYGDSYQINLLERPFLQDMTYLPNLDIRTFSLSQDETWYFISFKTIGSDPNALPEIYYAVELDMDKDGFGDFIILAQPPYLSEWTTQNVRVFADENQNTSGLSPAKSDAPFQADGYETLIFDGAQGLGEAPDLAWARMVNNSEVSLQFAFKKSWAGSVFLFGVLADAGLKDVSQLDYVDHFTEEQAGSPVRKNKHYPLKALYSVDNTYRQAVGFVPTGYEPMICPNITPPTASKTKQPGGEQPPGGGQCSIDPADCTANAPFFWPYPHCACSATPFYANP